MMRPLSFLLIASGLLLLSLAGTVSAGEETFSITVEPGSWNYREEVYLTNITNSSYSDWWPIDWGMGENFTFTIKADNLENGTEYLFSFEITYYTSNTDPNDITWWEDRLVVTNASHHFIGNNIEEYVYNLTGQLTSEYGGQALDHCTILQARFTFVKNPNAKNDTFEEIANITSRWFVPGEYGVNEESTRGTFDRWMYDQYDQTLPHCDSPSPSNLSFMDILFLLILSIFFISTYKMFKLMFRPEEETNPIWALFWLVVIMQITLYLLSWSW